jgi:3-oxoacyl-[acyl-carrier protein] reductase
MATPPPTAQPRPFDEFEVGQTASLDQVVTADAVDRFAALTGDDNPLHVDDAYARSLGGGGRVVHGMLTGGFVSTVIGTLLPGPGALWMSQRFDFRAPVRIGDALHVEVRIRQVSPGTRVLVLDVSVHNQNGKVVLDGEAQVQVLAAADPSAVMSGRAQTAVVTGSGRGIGAAIASRLAADGLRVVVNYRQDGERAADIVDAIRGAGGETCAIQADVSDPHQARHLLDEAVAAFGPVDVLVNNAGGPTDPRPLRDTSWADMERHLATHLQGSFHCVQAVLPNMVERRFGRIVSITSQAGYGVPPPQMTGYAVAKAALAAFTRSVALEAGPSGVTANAVAPGMSETDMVADIPQRTKLTLATQSPLRRLAGVDDVADVVSFLVGPGGGYVTGQTIHLSGGQVMA